MSGSSTTMAKLPAFPGPGDPRRYAVSTDAFDLPRNAKLPVIGLIKREYSILACDIEINGRLLCVFTVNKTDFSIFPGISDLSLIKVLEKLTCDGTLGHLDFRHLRQVLTPSTLHLGYITRQTTGQDLAEWRPFTPELRGTDGKLKPSFLEELGERAQIAIELVREAIEYPALRENRPRQFKGSWFKFTRHLQALKTLDEPVEIAQALGKVQRAILEGTGFHRYVTTLLGRTDEAFNDWTTVPDCNPLYMGGWGNLLDITTIHYLLDAQIPLLFLHPYNMPSDSPYTQARDFHAWNAVGAIPQNFLQDPVRLTPRKDQRVDILRFWKIKADQLPDSTSGLPPWLLSQQALVEGKLQATPSRPLSGGYNPSDFLIPYEQRCKNNRRAFVLWPMKAGDDEEYTPWAEHPSCRGLYFKITQREWEIESALTPENVWYDRHHKHKFVTRFHFCHIDYFDRKSVRDDYGQPFPYAQAFFSEDGRLVDEERPRWIYTTKRARAEHLIIRPKEKNLGEIDDVSKVFEYYQLCAAPLPEFAERYLAAQSSEEEEVSPMVVLPSSQIPRARRQPEYLSQRPTRDLIRVFQDWRQLREAASMTRDVPPRPGPGLCLQGNDWFILGGGRRIIKNGPQGWFQPVPPNVYSLPKERVTDRAGARTVVRFEHADPGTTPADWIALLLAITKDKPDIVKGFAVSYHLGPLFYCLCDTYGGTTFLHSVLHGQSIDGRQICVSYVKSDMDLGPKSRWELFRHGNFQVDAANLPTVTMSRASTSHLKFRAEGQPPDPSSGPRRQISSGMSKLTVPSTGQIVGSQYSACLSVPSRDWGSRTSATTSQHSTSSAGKRSYDDRSRSPSPGDYSPANRPRVTHSGPDRPHQESARQAQQRRATQPGSSSSVSVPQSQVTSLASLSISQSSAPPASSASTVPTTAAGQSSGPGEERLWDREGILHRKLKYQRIAERVEKRIRRHPLVGDRLDYANILLQIYLPQVQSLLVHIPLEEQEYVRREMLIWLWAALMKIVTKALAFVEGSGADAATVKGEISAAEQGFTAMLCICGFDGAIPEPQQGR